MQNEMCAANKNVRARNKINLKRNCPIAFTISVIGGRWKLSILALLNDFGAQRYSMIKIQAARDIRAYTHASVKELEQCDLISKTIHAQVPPRTEYALSEKGKPLQPILDEMTRWDKMNFR
jgi:DNA-binding HxlR family transcriptional regulator